MTGGTIIYKYVCINTIAQNKQNVKITNSFSRQRSLEFPSKICVVKFSKSFYANELSTRLCQRVQRIICSHARVDCRHTQLVWFILLLLLAVLLLFVRLTSTKVRVDNYERRKREFHSKYKLIMCTKYCVPQLFFFFFVAKLLGFRRLLTIFQAFFFFF